MQFNLVIDQNLEIEIISAVCCTTADWARFCEVRPFIVHYEVERKRDCKCEVRDLCLCSLFRAAAICVISVNNLSDYTSDVI